MNRPAKIVFWLALIALMVLYPKLFGIYYTNVFVTFSIFAVYSASMNLLMSFSGLLSFGHAMFFGAGGFATALALTHIEGIGTLSAMGFGLLAALLLAALLSPVVSRLGGNAFAMLHLAFGQILYVLALRWKKITGGEDGIGNFPIPDLNLPGLGTIALKDSPENFYYFAMIILGLSTFLMWYFTKTPFGQVQIGVRDNEDRMNYLGYKVPLTKALVYIVSGTFAGIAGSIYGLFQHLVSPEGSLSLLICFMPLLATLIGGVGTFFGPILGTAVIQVIEEITVSFSDRIEPVAGFILILFIMFIPGGILGAIAFVRAKFRGKVNTVS